MKSLKKTKQIFLPVPEIGELWCQTHKFSKKEYRLLIVDKYVVDSFGVMYKVLDLEKESMLYLKFDNLNEYEYTKM